MSDRPQVMIVEDDRPSRMALVALMRLSGFQAVQATTVEEAMRLLSPAPLCLILDLMLPDGDGSSILEYIRARNLPIRVAITTGAADWQQLVDAPRLHPDAVFQKPVDYERLSSWLNECATRP